MPELPRGTPCVRLERRRISLEPPPPTLRTLGERRGTARELCELAGFVHVVRSGAGALLAEPLDHRPRPVGVDRVHERPAIFGGHTAETRPGFGRRRAIGLPAPGPQVRSDPVPAPAGDLPREARCAGLHRAMLGGRERRRRVVRRLGPGELPEGRDRPIDPALRNFEDRGEPVEMGPIERLVSALQPADRTTAETPFALEPDLGPAGMLPEVT